MHTPKVTPKDFVLWVGAMATLYGGVFSFIALIFNYISKAFPNPLAGAYSYAESGDVSYQMASLIVLTPVFLLLMRMIRSDIARDPSRSEIWVRRWALFLTLFLAGATIVIDLIVLLTTFLQGEELTSGFLLKVLTVLLVAGLGFMHFLADLWGYWAREKARATMVNYAVGLVVLIAIVAGFFIVGTPREIRMQKQDDTRVQDLQNIQWQVVNYWQQKEVLPQTLAELNDPISNSMIPLDPETGAAYEYRATGEMSFELCATFALPGGGTQLRPVAVSVEPPAPKMLSDNWQHDAGRECFQRTIDPEKYPPLSRSAQ